MPYNLLLLPLIGGYLFINQFNRWKFLAQRTDGYHFLFETSLAGILLLAFSELLIILLRPSVGFIDVAWHRVLPMSGSGVTSLSFVLGLTLPWLLNYFFPIGREVERAIQLRATSFEQIFDYALRTMKPVQVILRSGKVYVGHVLQWSGPLHEDDAITLLPMFEGYQHTEDKGITYTADYASAFQLAADKRAGLTIDDIGGSGVAVHVSDIEVVNLFSMALYQQLQLVPVEQPSKKVNAAQTARENPA
jgi:hypothetical protein